MSDTQTPLETPRLYLEIVKGSTRFPNRPVYEGVFLIGSGTNCDMRLGGDDTPAVHSVVRAEAGEVHIESLSRKPVLRVNGIPCERGELSDGDRIQIGSVQLIAKFQVAVASQALVGSPVIAAQPEPEIEIETELGEEDLSRLSTERLIALLEEDLAMVEEHTSREASGADLLIEAARTAHAPVPVEEEDEGHGLRIVDPDEELQDDHAEAEQLIVALNRIADDLNDRVDHLRQKEEVYTEAADDLLNMQNRFSTLLERVLERLDSRDTPQHRRSA